MSDQFADARDAWLFRVLANDKLLASEKNVAAYLALRFNRKAGGVAWPSLEKIAHGVHISRSTAAKAIDSLKARGFIEVKSGGGRRSPHEGISNRYRMLQSGPPDCKAGAQQSGQSDGKSELPSGTPDCKSAQPSSELPSDPDGSYRPAHRTQTPDRTPEEVSKKEGKKEGGAPQARQGTASFDRSVLQHEDSLDSPHRATTIDDESGVAWRAPPPDDHLYIDQSGNPVPPPPDRRRPHPRGKSNVERGREMLRGCGQ